MARGNEVAIVDTGTAGNQGPIADALSALTLDWSNVNHVVLTHLHGDHVGGLPGVLGTASAAAAYAGTADVAGIDSPRPLVGLADGDEVLGMEVIATPGHTPGSICLLDAAAGLLVAGDALTVSAQGMLTGPNQQFTPNMAQAADSLRTLATRSYNTVLVGHGDPYENEDAPQVTAALGEAVG